MVLIIPIKLSLPGVKSPKPARSPVELSNEFEALLDKFTSVSSAVDPTIDRRSGPLLPNLVMPIGTLSSSEP